MALFSFTDISFLSKPRVQSSANQLTENSQYQSNIFRYPIDIGDTDKGHYMVIHINEQLATSFKGTPSSDLPTVIQNRTDGTSFSTPEQALSVATDLLVRGTEIAQRGLDKISPGTTIPKINEERLGENSFKVGFTRTIQRTTDTIALYMPDTINFSHNQRYSDLELSGFLAAAASSVSSIKDNMEGTDSVTLKSMLGNLSPFIARFLQSNAVGAAFSAAYFQKAVNPLLEMIYTSPAFREFRFEFMFYPRSEKEAIEVQNLIRRLHFHQAPEIDTSSAGFFLVPPSEFDIKFYYNGKENPNIPKISTCVLTGIDVDYAPNGFAAYEVPGETVPNVGRTGMPVGIRLSLSFKETEIMTKNHFENLPQGVVTVPEAAIRGDVSGLEKVN